jgi:hypothetical protein
MMAAMRRCAWGRGHFSPAFANPLYLISTSRQTMAVLADSARQIAHGEGYVPGTASVARHCAGGIAAPRIAAAGTIRGRPNYRQHTGFVTTEVNGHGVGSDSSTVPQDGEHPQGSISNNLRPAPPRRSFSPADCGLVAQW